MAKVYRLGWRESNLHGVERFLYCWQWRRGMQEDCRCMMSIQVEEQSLDQQSENRKGRL